MQFYVNFESVKQEGIKREETEIIWWLNSSMQRHVHLSFGWVKPNFKGVNTAGWGQK